MVWIFGEIDMNAPTQDDKNEMARLMQIMEGKRPPPIALKSQANIKDPILLSTKPTEKEISDMDRFLKIVKGDQSLNNKVTSAVETLVEDAKDDSRLQEALITEQTENGMKIGVWEIRKTVHEGLTSKNETLYYIKNTSTNSNIKAQFMILESAKTIVRLLNKGVNVSDEKIQNIASLELEYRRLREKALKEKQMWRRANKANDEFKMTLYEATFDAAKSRALYIREKIRNIYYKI